MREKQRLCPHCYFYPNTRLAPSPSGRIENSVKAQSDGTSQRALHTAPQTLPCPFHSNTPATGSSSVLIMSEKRAVWCRRFSKPQSYIKPICFYFNCGGLCSNQLAFKVLYVKEAQQSLRQDRNTLHKYRGGNVTRLQCIETSLEAGLKNILFTIRANVRVQPVPVSWRCNFKRPVAWRSLLEIFFRRMMSLEITAYRTAPQVSCVVCRLQQLSKHVGPVLPHHAIHLLAAHTNTVQKN